MLGLIVFLYLSTVGNILSQDIVVLQVVKTEPVVVILNNTQLNARNVPDSNTSDTAEPDTVYRIKKPEKTPAITVETDQKEWLWWFNFMENKTMNMSNKVDKKDDQIKVNISQSNGNDTTTGDIGNKHQHSNNKTLVEGFQKPTDLGGMKTTNVTLDDRTGINGDGCSEGYVKVDGKCVKEIK